MRTNFGAIQEAAQIATKKQTGRQRLHIYREIK